MSFALQLLKVAGVVGGSSGYTALTAPENLSLSGSGLSCSQFLPPVLGAQFVPPQDDRDGKPQGQGWVVAEREEMPSPDSVRCSLLTAQAPSSTESKQEVSAESGLGVGSRTSPSMLLKMVFPGVAQILSVGHRAPSQGRRQN